MAEDRPGVAAEHARRRAVAARVRAAASADAAERCTLLWQQDGSERHVRLAAFHREAAAHHLAAAEMQEAYARRVGAWAPGGQESRPRFMGSVVAACGPGGGALVLLDQSLQQLAVASSDARAEKAQDLEYVLGEGPMREASRRGRAVVAVGSELVDRWPQYGRGVLDLGIRAAAAAPLMADRRCFGAIAVFDQTGLSPAAELQDIAAALTTDILLGPDQDPLLHGEIDEQSVIHQASGMVAERADCTIPDALALIKARAFREGATTDGIARRVVHSGLRLTSEPE
ncbi:ANTAR domain-containing protein [Streptomyces atriruber]|uniref:ANTAR domain-containing protein n=1 Tax=Streptomyces atriruber TaxID=545121 RepID=A0ABV3BXH9_9ACTN